VIDAGGESIEIARHQVEVDMVKGTRTGRGPEQQVPVPPLDPFRDAGCKVQQVRDGLEINGAALL